MNPHISRRRLLKVGLAGGAALFVPWHFARAIDRIQLQGTARSGRHHEVRDPAADSAGDAPGGHDPRPWAASRSTTTRSRCGSSRSRSCPPVCQPPRSGATARSPRRGKRACCCTTRHRSPSRPRGTGRSGSSGSTSLVDASGTTCRTCCRWIRPCTGPTRPAGSDGRDGAPVRRHARPVHRPGPDRHPRSRSGRRRRRERWLRRGVVPAERGQHPGRLRDGGHLVRLLQGQGPARFGADWGPGFATFQYPNDQRASTIWYHDHAWA